MTDTDTSADAVSAASVEFWEHYGYSAKLGLICTALAAERDALRDQYTYIGKDGKSVLAKDLEAERDTLRQQLAEARNAALEEAADACSYGIKNYDAMKPDGTTYESLRVQKVAKGMVSVVREDILALKTNGDNT